MDTEVIVGGAALLWWLLRKKKPTPAADASTAVQLPNSNAGASLSPAQSINAIDNAVMPVQAKPAVQSSQASILPHYTKEDLSAVLPAENFLPVENPAMEPNPVASGLLFNNNEVSSTTTVRRIGVRNMTPIPEMVGIPDDPQKVAAMGMS
jgi:hypothetical protein